MQFKIFGPPAVWPSYCEHVSGVYAVLRRDLLLHSTLAAILYFTLRALCSQGRPSEAILMLPVGQITSSGRATRLA